MTNYSDRINRTPKIPEKPKKMIRWTVLENYKGWSLVEIKHPSKNRLLFVAKAWLDFKHDIVSWNAYWLFIDATLIPTTQLELIEMTVDTGTLLDKENACRFFPEFSQRARYRRKQ